ncbi:MAG: nickel/cobalt transporter [Pseudorhodobacter sp.]
MPRSLILAGVVVVAAVLVFLGTGGMDLLSAWAAAGQREAQNALAGALRSLRAGEPGAFGALIGLAFAYGVFHAAGPGHGKVLIGGYGMAERVRLGPLVAIAIASSLAQATTAVVLVYAGVLVLNLTRETMVGVTEEIFAPASYAAIGLIGVWLAWRGARKLWRQSPALGARIAAAEGPGGALAHAAVDPHHHAAAQGSHSRHDAQHDPAQGDHARHHHHDHDDTCGCGHRHAPTMAEVARVNTFRDALVLIAGVAIRPCTGALFLLILTWRMGIDAVGIAGAYAMGLGTASITVAVAVLAVWAREGTILALSGGRLARAVPLIEFGAGLAVALISFQMMRGAL